ncbi:MAG: tripartite tricarboxylate transporter TctB family protein [Rhodospirillaceae bacterium]|nr:tripartite tricarboxylate transporter TctB family protein [Rhodospirillaceae bacterium]MBT5945463.1 tripartite tricarboxylate transporter TctB family protein [Rhodospirillaceae bacterium]MBT6403059.1 tripartite tricarboxylate transporter TctB family protein [Rhodospirillaceae bacterium]MBT6536320.1 tripartite tricarboxylate transporter TctB family protein [Rhodospirillaceae bacterium]
MKRLADRDLLTAIMLFGVSALFSVGSSSDPKDWAFPLLANYVTLGIAIAFLAKFIVASVRKHVPDLLVMTADDKASAVDVVVFMVIVLAFLLAMFRLGFWPSSLIMLIGASLYLTRERTTRNIRMAIIAPICISIVAFLVFTQVFYVPFPESSWFAG